MSLMRVLIVAFVLSATVLAQASADSCREGSPMVRPRVKRCEVW